MRLRAELNSIRIETSVQAPTSLFADRLHFKQILLNLLSNAVKSTPEGGQIRVDATTTPGCLTISVSDTGIGIPARSTPRPSISSSRSASPRKGLAKAPASGSRSPKRWSNSTVDQSRSKANPARAPASPSPSPSTPSDSRRCGYHPRSSDGIGNPVAFPTEPPLPDPFSAIRMQASPSVFRVKIRKPSLLRLVAGFTAGGLLWLLFVFQLPRDEILAGAAASLLTILAVASALRCVPVCFHPRAVWLAQSAELPMTALADFGKLFQDLSRTISRKPSKRPSAHSLFNPRPGIAVPRLSAVWRFFS